MANKIEVGKEGTKSEAGLARAEAGAHPFLALRDQMDRLFDEFMGGWRMPSPSRDLFRFEPFQMPAWGRSMVDVRFDVSETDDAVEMTAELPGIDEKDIDLSLSDGVLTIKGEKKSEKETEERDYHLSERRYGSFARSMRLPDSVNQDKIEAHFEKGVLKVVMPKRAEARAKKKKIAIG